MKERTLFGLLVCIAIVFAAQYWVAQNANQFCAQVELKTDAAIATLLADAEVEADRRFNRQPFGKIQASVCETTIVDLIFFRRRCDIEFTTYKREGSSFSYFKHEHDYAFDLFGKLLRDKTEAWFLTFD